MGYELCRSVFNLSPERDWRYCWLQKLPMVSAPPSTSAFKSIDPWYAKFTWAREFPVIGHAASNEALLHANEIIRRMFAYRHDILKALIGDGVKLVVLATNETIADLPEYKKLADKSGIDPTLRYLPYSRELKLLVVGEENVSANPRAMYMGDNQIIRVMADAIYRVAGARPVIPDYHGNQQYELRVKRLDIEFDEKISKLFGNARAAQKWQRTSALEDKLAYWTTGVLAYFDASGQSATPNGSPHPISNREALKQYDPELYTLVNDTMAYEGHVDWRLNP
jgi:alpha-glucosidase